MKTLTFILLLSTTSLFAHLGERIQFDLYVDNINAYVDSSVEVVSLQADKYCLKNTYTHSGQSDSDIQCVEKDSLQTKEALKQIIDLCESQNLGVLESIEDPNDQTKKMDVCKIESSKLLL